MKTSDLLTFLREEYLDDAVEPFQWSDIYLLRLLNTAEQEAARRADLLLDETHATAADLATGVATATTVGALVDSAAVFVSTEVGKTVYNTTKNTFATITALISGTQLTLSSDIMVSGDSYIIGDPAYALTRICLESEIAQYPTSQKIKKIVNCYRASDGYPLLQKTEAWLDTNFAQWRSIQGAPIYYIEKKGMVRVTPIPDATINSGTGKDTLIFGAYRLPLRDMVVTGNSAPEIDEQYHINLLDHVCELAYAKQDADTYDAQKSIRHAQAFIQKFGPPVSALVEQNMRLIPSGFRLDGPKF